MFPFSSRCPSSYWSTCWLIFWNSLILSASNFIPSKSCSLFILLVYRWILSVMHSIPYCWRISLFGICCNKVYLPRGLKRSISMPFSLFTYPVVRVYIFSPLNKPTYTYIFFHKALKQCTSWWEYSSSKHKNRPLRSKQTFQLIHILTSQTRRKSFFRFN